jgi:hypothetical protein
VVVVERAAADESVSTARGKHDASGDHLVEGGTGSLDAGENTNTGRGETSMRVRREHRPGLIAQKGKKGVSTGEGEREDGKGMKKAIEFAGRVNRRKYGTDAGGFEFTAVSDSGRQLICGEEQMIAARASLGESGYGSAESGAPAMVGEMIVPVGDEKGRGAAEDDTEIGVGVEKPLAGKGWVSDTGSVGAVTRLDVLGARFEGDERDVEVQPPAGAEEAGQTQNEAMGRQGGSHSYSRSAMALRTEVSSMADF